MAKRATQPSPEFLTALSLLTGAYPQGFSVTDAAIETWWHFFRDAEPQQFFAVVESWVAAERRPPTIADIRDRLASLNGSDAESAWRWVLDQIGAGRYRQPGFQCSERIGHAVRAAGGWRAIGHTDEGELHYRKRDFAEGYRVAIQREDVGLLPPPARLAIGKGGR